MLTELLATQPDLGQVVRRVDAFAARTPALRAATLALAVLEPAGGTLRYTTCGHPPPLVIGADGATRYLEGTETGPLGTGSPPVLATGALAPGELVLLYSDGLIERPDRTLAEGMAELAVAAAGTARETAAEAAGVDHVCQRTVELLARADRADDITALAAQRLTDPVPDLHLELPSERPSLTTARDAFARWLSPARRYRRGRRRAAPGPGGGLHQRHRARLSARRARDHRARGELARRRVRGVPGDRPRQLAAHGQDLTLITAPGSAAHLVPDLVRLAHIAGNES